MTQKERKVSVTAIARAEQRYHSVCERASRAYSRFLRMRIEGGDGDQRHAMRAWLRASRRVGRAWRRLVAVAGS